MRPTIGIMAVAAFVGLAIVVNVGVFREPLREWLKPQPILTLAGVLVGVIVLRWQLSVQHRNALRANAEKDRNELNLEIYRDVSGASEEADRAVMPLFGLTIAGDGAWTFEIEPPKVSEFRDATNRCTEAMVAVLARIQKWEIAFGGGHSKFAKALSQKRDNVRDTTARLLSLMETPGGADAFALREAVRGVRYTILELTGLLWDLRVESQNLLLGGLFQYRVPRRQPTDPSITVTTLT
jgi:hypothetical protein